MAKLNLTCEDFRPLERGTLQGFATIRIAEMCLTIRDIAVHKKGERAWAQLPAKPQLNSNRELVKDQDGKVQYVPFFRWDSPQVSDAFSAAVLRAVNSYRSQASVR